MNTDNSPDPTAGEGLPLPVVIRTQVERSTRLFAGETGMTFARWRTQVRIRAALTHLARGTSVGATARAVGYRKPGAFGDAFHRITGQSPSIYLANRG